MKTIYFVRHAKSSWADFNMPDIKRPLNKRGFRDAPFMGKMLMEQGVSIDLICSSPANRALSTAKLIATEIEYPKEKIIIEDKIYEAYYEDILSFVRTLEDTINTVMIFGHNPSFTSLANYFSENFIPNIPTCGIFKVEANIDAWVLINQQNAERTEYYYPKQKI